MVELEARSRGDRDAGRHLHPGVVGSEVSALLEVDPEEVEVAAAGEFVVGEPEVASGRRRASPTQGYSRLAQLEMQSEPGTVKLRMLAFVQGDGTWTALPGLPAGVGDVDDVYECVGGNLMNLPTLTDDARQLLLESASCLNCMG